MAANKPKRWIFGLDFILFVRWCFVSHVHLWWFWIYHIIKHDRFQRMGSASWKMDTVHYTVGCLKFYSRPPQNTRISTWKMMRCGGKFLWILNWVKGSQVKRRILGNSLMPPPQLYCDSFDPCKKIFHVLFFAGSKTRLRNQCNPHFSLWIVILLSRTLPCKSRSRIVVEKLNCTCFACARSSSRIFDVWSKMTLCAEMHWNVSFFYSR